MNYYHLIAVGIGGMIGSIARYITSKTIDEKFASVLPYGTLVVNIAGSLVLGFLYALIIRKTGLSDQWRLFLATGFCGGFTTFSAFALENFNLLHTRPGISLFYITVSLLGGVLAIGAGFFLGRSLS